MGVLFASMAFSSSFIHGTQRFAPHFSIEPGFLFGWFIAAFIAIFAYVVSCVVHEYRATTGAKKNQMRYIGLAYALGFFSGALHFGTAYLRVEPLPHDLFIIGYVSTIAYAVVRHRLLDLKVAIMRTVIFAIVYTFVLGGPFFLVSVGEDILSAMLGSHWWYVPLLLSTSTATVAPFIFLFFQRTAEARLLKEQRRYQATLLNAAKGMTQIRNLQRLLNLIVHMLTYSMKLTHAGLFLHEEQTGQYVLRACRDRVHLTPGLVVARDDPLILWFRDTQAPLVSEELRQLTNGQVTPPQLADSLKRIGASVVIPSFAEDNLIGFLLLGDKKTGQMYTQDDLNVLQTLANQVALAIQNAQFYAELQKTAELIHTARLSSIGKMASGIAHQIHNRMACLIGEANLIQAALPRLQAPATAQEHQAAYQEIETKLSSICEEGMKGRQIAKSLLDFAKPSTDRQLISLDEVVTKALWVAGLKHDLSLITVHLDLPGHPYVKVNIGAIQDVFFNLLDNAAYWIKAKAEHLRLGLLPEADTALSCEGRIAIEAVPSPDKTKWLITVSDNGLGVKPEDQKGVFVPFFTRKGSAEEGTGMGLYTAWEIVRAHGGSLTLQQSEYGKGTTFLIELSIPEEERSWLT
jgi:two-component system NtrC family sensor kinase